MDSCPTCHTPSRGLPSCPRCGRPASPGVAVRRSVPGTITAVRVLLGLNAAGNLLNGLFAVFLAVVGSALSRSFADVAEASDQAELDNAVVAMAVLAGWTVAVVVFDVWAIAAVGRGNRSARTAITLMPIAHVLLALVMTALVGPTMLATLVFVVPLATAFTVLLWLPESSKRHFDGPSPLAPQAAPLAPGAVRTPPPARASHPPLPVASHPALLVAGHPMRSPLSVAAAPPQAPPSPAPRRPALDDPDARTDVLALPRPVAPGRRTGALVAGAAAAVVAMAVVGIVLVRPWSGGSASTMSITPGTVATALPAGSSADGTVPGTSARSASARTCPLEAAATLPEPASGALVVAHSARVHVALCRGLSGGLYYYGANDRTHLTITLPATRAEDSWVMQNNGVTYTLSQDLLMITKGATTVADEALTDGW